MQTSPTLSILIPIYNRSCRLLLDRLQEEIKGTGIKAEIILGDDCSDKAYTEEYTAYEEEGLCRLFISQENIGAGRLRNRLAQEAKGDQLLILDSDTLPGSPDFLRQYLQRADENHVVCGGFFYPGGIANPLRQRYGERVESKPAEERARTPHAGFISMAFMIPREKMLSIGFPPNMGMGYEDVLFGERLRQAGVPILHIDNPVEHHHHDTAAQFLTTTRRYLDNLHRHREELNGLVRLLRTYHLLRQTHLTGLAALSWRALHKILERQLTSSTPSLLLFSVYKLLYFTSLPKE